MPLGEIPNHNGKAAGAELSRLAEIGVRGAEFAPATMTHPFWSDEWEPLWDAGEETQLPVSFHAFNFSTTFSDKDTPPPPPSASVLLPPAPTKYSAPSSSPVYWNGTRDSTPSSAKAASAGFPSCWSAWTTPTTAGSQTLELPLLPSEYFKRQVYASFIIDYWGTKAMWELGYLEEHHVVHRTTPTATAHGPTPRR